MPEQVRIVHISDPHLASGYPFHFSYLGNKRIVGYLNLVLKRRRQHKRRLAFAMRDAVQALFPDHLLVTGDFTNIGLDEEFDVARKWIEGFGLPSDQVTVLPGNHDAYIGSVWTGAVFVHAFRPYLPPDALEKWPWDVFPLVRRVGRVTIFGLSSSVPCPPFLAWGRVGSGQIQRLSQALEAEKGSFRILALHHPLHPKAARWDNALLDAPALRAVLAKTGVELVVTGHLHRPFDVSMAGPDGAQIPVLGVGSASLDHASGHKRAQFRVLDVWESEEGWHWSQELWVHSSETGTYRRFEEMGPSRGQEEGSSSTGVRGPIPES